MSSRDELREAQGAPLGTVVVIDDNDEVRRELATALSLRGWRVASAKNLKLGLDLCARDQPHAVMTELSLPDVNGLQFGRALRSLVEHDLLVIGLTRLPEEMWSLAASAGFDHVQSKPIDHDELHDRLLVGLRPPTAEATG